MAEPVDHNKTFDEISQSFRNGKLTVPPSGIHVFMNENKDKEEVNILLELQRLKEWLQSQTLELETVLKLRKTHTPSMGVDDDDEVEYRIMELQHKLLDVTASNSLKELVIKRIQCTDALLKILFPRNKEDKIEDQQVYIDLVDEQTKLVTEILGHQKAIERTQKELDIVRQEAIGVKRENRVLMSGYQQMKADKVKTKKTKKRQEQEELIQKEVEDITSKITITQHILQALIMGSGVNWAKDPELQQLLISLGETVDLSKH
ncbi:centromere protein H-like [Antedon mediterranea]|uniref:centromere protein H-like n=1 Tax=Antedon mediterranea TaxID=105859 RepID=UPI003AF73D5D